jgi:predicted secreted hydrolase
MRGLAVVLTLPLALLAGAAGCGGCSGAGTGAPASSTAATGGEPLSVARALRAPADARGFARALSPRPFVFPADHGPHPDFRTEWWYFTGNLAATAGTGVAGGAGRTGGRDGPAHPERGENPGSAEDRRYGFQLTLFRTALAPPPAATAAASAVPEPAERRSAWATRQVWFAHLAVTDAAGRRFHCYERWERQALGLAGATAEPFRVWVGNWSATAAPLPLAPAGAEGPAGRAAADASLTSAARRTAGGAAAPPGSAARARGPLPGAPLPIAAGTPPIRLIAAAGAPESGGMRAAGQGAGDDAHDADDAGGQCPGSGRAAIDLLLTGSLPPVAQGDHGLSAKSAEQGNASYYYSMPRLAATGTVSLDGSRVPVAGLVWMDREWSTSALDAGETGWDWFALQLDDGWELMLYRLRRRTAPSPGRGAGQRAVMASGRAAAGGGSDRPGEEITDPASLATLIAPDGHTERFAPASWRLEETPLLAGQELLLALRYWEGAVVTGGTHGGQPVRGRGYVELTGYGEPPPGAAAP